ncbi:ATP11-domain-containing protein [Cucurbitaria berberidis CBS 394.84]|uniref:ATP11-domain-containing protein n=1 Tax=Cucurbitaria berberidis CBS 394.84 TaxID=1168544 RepID=A0A9P4GH78_9PLEO|nr:ATP11-domain-containing protein [Cucurbitaria berberidis CBS 394.84]KAF1845567.1 ATP11-domain-containing protein [Cucurbitaria berberidis CBS 394.84]
MAFRSPTLRHVLRQPLSNPRFCQRRWAQVQDVRFLATHDAQERILAKYREKLESKAKQEGVKDISELKERHKDKINELRQQAIVPGATGPLTPPPSPQGASPSSPSSKAQSPWPSPPPPPSPQSRNAPPPGVKTLNSFLDLPKIRELPEKEIQALWRLRHASNPQSIHFSVPATTFRSLLETAKRHPSFVLPVPREIPKESADGVPAEGETQQAAELHYLQFAHPHVDTTTLLFTSLAEFKLRGEFASPHTTITFHQELADSHNLVLGQGIVTEGNNVSVDDARWLVMCMQKFYVQSEEGKGREALLHQFTRGDSGFKVERLIDEAEKIL